MTICASCGYEADAAFKFCPECGAQQVGGAQGDPMVGRTLAGKYRVVEQIGAGSMGVVYRGEHASLKKRIAIKILHRDLRVAEEAMQRFQREGIAAGQLSHPNVIQVFDFDKDADGLVFLAMEYVDGLDLKSWLAEKGPMAPEEAVEIVRQLVSTLAEAHGHGIVHRDLKPENLMIAESVGAERTLKVLDFGLSKLIDRPTAASLQTMAGRVLGTPLYMAPEQWRGEEVDHRADLYAATLILYELIVGKPPFAASDVTEVMRQTTTEEPPVLSGAAAAAVPAELDDVVATGLAKDPEQRYQSAAEMLQALDEVRYDSGSGSRRGMAQRRRAARSAPRRARRAEPAGSKMPLVAGGIGGLVVIAALAWWWGGGGGGESAPLIRHKAPAARTELERGYASLLSDVRDRLRQRDDTTAMVLAEKALGMSCADAEVFALRAAVYRQRGDDDTALADYKAALERYPEYAEAMAGIGWIEFERSRFEQAGEQFDAALRADADCAAALAGRAAVLQNDGQADRGLALLSDAAARLPESAVVHLWRGKMLLAASRPVDAVVSFIEAKRNDARSAEAVAGLGDAYFAKGEPDAAVIQYREAVGLAPDDLGLRRKLVELLLAGDEVTDASDALEPALRGGVRDGNLLVLAGVIEQRRGDPAAALDRLRNGLDRGCDEAARVHVLVAQLLLENGAEKAAEARGHCEQAAELGEDSAELHAAWGLALFREEQYQAAAAQLETAVARVPDHLFARYTLGVLYMDYLDDTRKAVLHLTEYRRFGGDAARVDDWIRRLDQ